MIEILEWMFVNLLLFAGVLCLALMSGCIVYGPIYFWVSHQDNKQRLEIAKITKLHNGDIKSIVGQCLEHPERKGETEK